MRLTRSTLRAFGSEVNAAFEDYVTSPYHPIAYAFFCGRLDALIDVCVNNSFDRRRISGEDAFVMIYEEMEGEGATQAFVDTVVNHSDSDALARDVLRALYRLACNEGQLGGGPLLRDFEAAVDSYASKYGQPRTTRPATI